MAPTIQTNGTPTDREKRPTRPVEKRSELICRVKYCNTLPDIPFDLKFINYPFESTRFIQYNPTSLERNYKYEVLTEHDLGVEIDLINRDTYAGDPNAQLDPADEKLLEEDVLTPQDSKRSRHHARSVSWLRRTEYISTEQTRFQPQTMDKVEAKVGFTLKKNFKEETLYMDRDSQIKAIDKTFKDNIIPIEKHYSKSGVVPVEVLPVFPDFKLWKYPCAQVIFDSDPAPSGRPVPAQIEEMSQAMIRGVMDESGEQFVAYFLPLEETMEKRRRDFAAEIEYADDEEYEYKMAREYNWNVKSKSSKGYEENYFLVMRNDGVYYNELETRVRLSKRRQKAGQQPNNTRLAVKHRPLTASEFKMQRYREKLLEPPNEDEEEEEEDDEDEDDEQEQGKAEDKTNDQNG
ncbi:RNA polymerase-associated factor [Cotesia glomerata]|uniref:RNA polymerase II-associated factor 1 homolog n=1 Tax=Cotesia glomerata TaxID=32391 RepID=A0AAV7J576_COTGL|nr:RNA polymerase-associated factor [Cotesia glomerata]